MLCHLCQAGISSVAELREIDVATPTHDDSGRLGQRTLAGGIPHGDDATASIVGGAQVEEGEFEFFAQGNGYCGGSHIAGDFILSAGHCRSEFRKFAYVGAYKFHSDNGGKTDVINVKRRIVSSHCISSAKYHAPRPN